MMCTGMYTSSNVRLRCRAVESDGEATTEDDATPGYMVWAKMRGYSWWPGVYLTCMGACVDGLVRVFRPLPLVSLFRENKQVKWSICTLVAVPAS